MSSLLDMILGPFEDEPTHGGAADAARRNTPAPPQWDWSHGQTNVQVRTLSLQTHPFCGSPTASTSAWRWTRLAVCVGPYSAPTIRLGFRPRENTPLMDSMRFATLSVAFDRPSIGRIWFFQSRAPAKQARFAIQFYVVCPKAMVFYHLLMTVDAHRHRRGCSIGRALHDCAGECMYWQMSGGEHIKGGASRGIGPQDTHVFPTALHPTSNGLQAALDNSLRRPRGFGRAHQARRLSRRQEHRDQRGVLQLVHRAR